MAAGLARRLPWGEREIPSARFWLSVRPPRPKRGLEMSEFLNMTKFKDAVAASGFLPDPLEIVGLVVGLAGPAHHAQHLAFREENRRPSAPRKSISQTLPCLTQTGAGPSL